MAIKLSIYEDICVYDDEKYRPLIDWCYFNSFCAYCSYLNKYPFYKRDLVIFKTTFEE